MCGQQLTLVKTPQYQVIVPENMSQLVLIQ